MTSLETPGNVMASAGELRRGAVAINYGLLGTPASHGQPLALRQFQGPRCTEGSSNNSPLLGSAARGEGTSVTNCVAAHADVAKSYLHFPVFFKGITQVSPGKAMGFTPGHKCNLKTARKLCSAPKFEWQKLF